jgi:hypothetical protein
MKPELRRLCHTDLRHLELPNELGILSLESRLLGAEGGLVRLGGAHIPAKLVELVIRLRQLPSHILQLRPQSQLGKRGGTAMGHEGTHPTAGCKAAVPSPAPAREKRHPGPRHGGGGEGAGPTAAAKNCPLQRRWTPEQDIFTYVWISSRSG